MDRPLVVLDQVLETLRSYQDEARRAGVELVGVVGSVARGDAGRESDIDLVYDVLRPHHLWPLLGVVAKLEQDLGRRIDIVDREMMPPERWAWMARDLVRL